MKGAALGLGAREPGDAYGASLAIFSGGAMLVGIPGQDIGDADDAGAALATEPRESGSGDGLVIHQGRTGGEAIVILAFPSRVTASERRSPGRSTSSPSEPRETRSVRPTALAR